MSRASLRARAPSGTVVGRRCTRSLAETRRIASGCANDRAADRRRRRVERPRRARRPVAARRWSRSSRATATGSGAARWPRSPPSCRDTIAVGTVHELDHVPRRRHHRGADADAGTPPTDPAVVLTVGSLDHVHAARRLARPRASSSWRRRCAASARPATSSAPLTAAVRAAGLDVAGVRHPPSRGRQRRRAPRRHLVVARRARPGRRGVGQPPVRGGVPRPARRLAGAPLPDPRRHGAVARRQGGAAPRRRRARRPRRPRRRARRLPPAHRAATTARS